MNGNAVRNVVFDWGGVLVDLDVEGCIKAFENAGVADVRTLITGTNEAGLFRHYECGDISTAEFREGVRRLTRRSLPDEVIDRLWNMEVLDIPEEKLRLLLDLSGRYNLYLLSNTNELHWETASPRVFRYEGTDVRSCFKQIFLSYRMRMAKPDPAIFRQVLSEAVLNPKETLFIDDAEVNCRSAASVGMQAVHYVPGSDLSDIFRYIS